MFGIFGVFSRPDDCSETAQPAGFPGQPGQHHADRLRCHPYRTRFSALKSVTDASIAAIGGDPRWITLRTVQTGILPASANQL
jgi:hypothetical protein